MSEKPLAKIATEINAHLKRLEADRSYNEPGAGRSKLYNSGAFRSGAFVAVKYISYQGVTRLYRDEAEHYLAKLDDGFKGRHEAAFRGWKSKTRKRHDDAVSARREEKMRAHGARWNRLESREAAREAVLKAARERRAFVLKFGPFVPVRAAATTEAKLDQALDAAVDALVALESEGA